MEGSAGKAAGAAGGKITNWGKKVLPKFLRKIAKRPPIKTGCFAAQTLVAICDPEDENWVGTQPIETIQDGDYVLSKDELSGHISCEQVSSPTIIPNQEIFEVNLRNANGEFSQIDATGNHPFFASGEWTRVDELGPGDVVQSRGDDLEVVEVERTQRFETVYNFTVSNYHTYFVGENAAWVHNTNTCGNLLDVLTGGPGERSKGSLADPIDKQLDRLPKNKQDLGELVEILEKSVPARVADNVSSLTKPGKMPDTTHSSQIAKERILLKAARDRLRGIR